MAKQVCDLRPSKGITAGESNEFLRNYKTYDASLKTFGFFDPTREHLNFEVGKGGKIVPVNKNISIQKRIKNNLSERGVKDPNAGMTANDPKRRRVVANMILGGSPDQMRKLAFGNQYVDFDSGADNRSVQRKEDIERWAVDMYRFVSNKYGEENIAAFIVHLDERNPHIHCSILPVVGGRVSWNKIFGGSLAESRVKYRQLHDELAEVNKKYDLDRGDDIRVTGAKHKSTEEYHRELRNQSTALEKQIENKKMTLKELQGELGKAERRVKGLTTMIGNLESQRASIEEELAKLQQDLEQGVMTAEEMSQEQMRLRQQLIAVENQITDKQKKLKDANILLNDTADKYAELLRKNEEIKEKIQEAQPSIKEKTLQEVGATAYEQSVEKMAGGLSELERFIDTLPAEQRDNINDILERMGVFDVAEMGNEMVAMAAALSLGYIDQVTNYAESHGGGGGPSGGWGRDKDDDDETWRRKCLMAVGKMMKPARSKIRRKR